MISYDYHLHSNFSGDSDAAPESMIQKACELGLAGICFTEHHDPDGPAVEEGYPFLVDFDTYFPAMKMLKEQYKDHIQIGIGMEFTIQDHLSPVLSSLCRQYPFDFIIGSFHFINGQDPYYPEFFHNRDEQSAYEEFFALQLEALKKFDPSEIDTLGHLDYIVRYGPNQNQYYSYEKYASLIDPILVYLLENRIALEVNTGGLKYGLGEPNPCTDILKRYYELGGRMITIGSDAHRPEHIAYDFQKCRKVLMETGFEGYTIFHNRTPELIPF